MNTCLHAFLAVAPAQGKGNKKPFEWRVENAPVFFAVLLHATGFLFESVYRPAGISCPHNINSYASFHPKQLRADPSEVKQMYQHEINGRIKDRQKKVVSEDRRLSHMEMVPLTCFYRDWRLTCVRKEQTSRRLGCVLVF